MRPNSACTACFSWACPGRSEALGRLRRSGRLVKPVSDRHPSVRASPEGEHAAVGHRLGTLCGRTTRSIRPHTSFDTVAHEGSVAIEVDCDVGHPEVFEMAQ